MIIKVLNAFDSFSKAAAALIPDWAVALIARFGIFIVFWRSAQTKLGGDLIMGQKLAFWNISDSTFMLFEYDYQVPLIPASVAAYLGTWGEFFFSLGILFGLLTRLSALGLFFMSLVILYVYTNDWPNIILWTGLLLYLLKNGAGAISLDALIRKNI